MRVLLLLLCAHVVISRHVSASHTDDEGKIKLETLVDKLAADTSAAFEEGVCDPNGCLNCLQSGCEFSLGEISILSKFGNILVLILLAVIRFS
jgi:hypothetical protein